MTRLLDRIRLTGSTIWAVISGAGWGIFSVMLLSFYRLVLAILALCAAILFSFWE